MKHPPLKLRKYLEAVQSISNGRSVESFVLEHGARFTPQPLPEQLPLGVKRGRMQQCFLNCYKAISRTSELHYVEGFAMPRLLGFGVHHAWLVDDSGGVLDLTWNDGEGLEYIGIPFLRRFVLDFSLKTETFCVLDNPPHSRPLLSGALPPVEWRHPNWQPART